MANSPAVGSPPPGASYTVTVRVLAPPHPALLSRLAQAVTSAGGVVVGMDLVEVAAAGTTVDLTLQAASEEHVAAVTKALGASRASAMSLTEFFSTTSAARSK